MSLVPQATSPVLSTPTLSAPALTVASSAPWACPRRLSRIPSGALIALITLSLATLIALLHAARLSVALTSSGALRYALVFAILGAVRWSCRRRARASASRLFWAGADLAGYVALFMAIALVAAIASYPLAGLSRGFFDADLQRADLALGFDWLAWYRFTAAHPLVQMVSRGAYAMIYVSPGLLLAWHAWSGQRAEAHAFLAAVWLSAWLTLGAFAFMPAVGPFAYLWHAPVAYLPVSDLWQPQLIPALRDHSFTTIDPGQLVGLVSAPSFHAASGVLLIAFAARQFATVPRLASVLIAIDVAMLLATPVEGTHYLIDLILGGLVAGFALFVVARWRSWLHLRALLPAAPGQTSALA
ncbi:phosphatase PAP2 family protein [Novosphingobium sp. 1949]|uniref:Phosphatase PAP2 family protein n=1 Tax=Novosphingobium organovorum TaxID=2930092 RepID=A0ABT0BFJ0_9SPHN|nr:phosphatase PAP2 family protein [Novosphingobium organovorum]MCJ2183675.1 phosphatase PAP2 family protein [Novosphingobium organovorum]